MSVPKKVPYIMSKICPRAGLANRGRVLVMVVAAHGAVETSGSVDTAVGTYITTTNDVIAMP